MTTTNTPFENSVDEILTRLEDYRRKDESKWENSLTHNEAKAALLKLHKAAIVAELEKHLMFYMDDQVSGDYKDGFNDAIEQFIKHLAKRIEQYKKEEKDDE